MPIRRLFVRSAQSPPDTTPPSDPTASLVAAASSSVVITLNPSSDNRSVAGYNYRLNGVTQPGTVQAGAVTISSLTPDTAYTVAFQAVDGSGNLSGWSSNVAFSTGTTGQSNTLQPNYPRIGAGYIPTSSWGSGTIRAKLAKYFYVTFTHYNGAESVAGVTAAAAMSAMKTLAPASEWGTAPVYDIYIVNNETFNAGSGDTSTQRLRDKLDAELWWLYQTGTSGAPLTSTFSSNLSLMNNSSYAPTSGGKNWIQWYADLMVVQNATGEAGNTANTYVDGLFLDNAFWRPRKDGDYNRDGTVDSASNTTIAAALRQGLASHFSYIRTVSPSYLRYHTANLSDVATCMGGGLYASSFTPDYSLCAPLLGAADGGLAEFLLGDSASRELQEAGNGATSFQVLRNEITFIDGLVNYPALNRYESYEITGDNSSADWRRFRFGFGAGTVVGDGCFDDKKSSDTNWFPDEYDNAGSRMGWLGQPTQVAQKSAWLQGVYRRDFDNGIVLVNPRNNGSQTVALGGTFYKINGRSNKSDLSVNDGATVTSVTLQDRDAIFLKRAP